MKQIQKNRTYLSVYLVIVIVAIITAYAVSLQALGFNWIIASLTALIILIITRIYTIGTAFYGQIKEITLQQEKESQEEISISDIINQKNTEEKEEKEQQEEELDKLIEQLSGENEPEKLGQKLLSQLGEELQIVQGLVYQYSNETEKFEVLSTYAYYGEEPPQAFSIGEGLSGQAARDQQRILLTELPDDYTEVISGLGKRQPKMLLLAPLIHEEKTVALVELSFFEKFSEQKIDKFEGILNKLAQHFA